MHAAVAEVVPCNPLVICGPSGIGKSLLAHALANHRQRAFALKSLLATSGAEIAQALASATEAHSVAALRTRYHRTDILLIDDLQQLADRLAAQQFLATAIDVLVRRGALVLVTQRQLPVASEGLLPTLASRLHGGLVVPLVPPQELARHAIVRQAAGHAGLALSDDHVARLARNDGKSRLATPPLLRQAVLRLASKMTPGQRLTPSMIDEALDSGEADLKQLVRQVASAVARQNSITLSELKGPVRRQSVAQARSLAMCLVRRMSNTSYADIGKHFGGRDHTTVLHACRKIERQAAADGALSRQLAEYATQLGSMSN
jgi:chromosomal replication initiator protein